MRTVYVNSMFFLVVSETLAINKCHDSSEMADVVLQYLRQIEDLK